MQKKTHYTSKYPALVLGTELKVSYFSLAIPVIHEFGSIQDEMHQIIILEVPLFQDYIFSLHKMWQEAQNEFMQELFRGFSSFIFCFFLSSKLAGNFVIHLLLGVAVCTQYCVMSQMYQDGLCHPLVNTAVWNKDPYGFSILPSTLTN
jgi:hypothetical protein